VAAGEPVSIHARANSRDLSRPDLQRSFHGNDWVSPTERIGYRAVTIGVWSSSNGQSVGNQGNDLGPVVRGGRPGAAAGVSLRYGLGDSVEEMTFEKRRGSCWSWRMRSRLSFIAVARGQPAPARAVRALVGDVVPAAEESIPAIQRDPAGRLCAMHGLSPTSEFVERPAKTIWTGSFARWCTAKRPPNGRDCGSSTMPSSPVVS